MTTNHNVQPNSGTLLGIVVDVSSSMQKNWRNQDSSKITRFENVRTVINKFLINKQLNYSVNGEENEEEIDLFCLGMGFKTEIHVNQKGDASFQKDHQIPGEVQQWKVHHVVCDVLALAELLPSPQKLANFQQQLDQRWKEYAGEIIDNAVITDDAYEELRKYLCDELYRSATNHLHQSLRYKLARIQPPDWLARYLRDFVGRQMQKITEISNKSSQRYTNDVYQKAKNDFEKHKEYYVSIIRNLVDSFAKEFTTAALKGMTLGFSLSELVENLSKEKALDIGAEILNALEKEVAQNIALSINGHIQRLHYDRRRIFARIDKELARYKTERLIRKVGWDILKPLVENTIKAVFVEHFEEQVSENLPYWIQLASMREVVRPLQDISYEIPGVDTQYATADKIMFGGTPFEQTLDKAAIRFIDKRYEDKKKVLVIISDGEFLQSKRTLLTAELLKKRGVIIISCVIANQNILTGFIQPAYPKWPAGVQKMLEVASEFSTTNPTLSWSYIQHQITEGKLCLQMNHTSILEDVFKTVFQYDEKEIFS